MLFWICTMYAEACTEWCTKNKWKCTTNTMYTALGPWWVVIRAFYRGLVYRAGRGCVRSLISFTPIYARPWSRTQCTRRTHSLRLRAGAHTCHASTLVKPLPEERCLPKSIREQIAEIKGGLLPLLLDRLCDRFYSLARPLWDDLTLGRRRIQASGNLDIRTSPSEQPPKVLHPLVRANAMWDSHLQKLANSPCILLRKRRPQNQFVEMPSHTLVAPRIRPRMQFHQRVRWKVWLHPERLPMSVKRDWLPGHMRLRRYCDIRRLRYHNTFSFAVFYRVRLPYATLGYNSTMLLQMQAS